METVDKDKVQRKNPGGRPRKVLKKSHFIAFKCTLVERKFIELNARKLSLPLSEYVRQMVLHGTISQKIKALPKEVLGFTGTLNHLAANLNQIAKKRNGIEELSLSERAELKVQSEEVKHLATEIKNYLRE